MPIHDEEFQQRLLEMFRIEAGEHLQAISAGLIELEKLPAEERSPTTIEGVFREAHSLKGAARAVGLKQIEGICQSLENVFAAQKSGRMNISQQQFDLLQDVIGKLGSLLTSITAKVAATEAAAIESLSQRLDMTLHATPPARETSGSSHTATDAPKEGRQAATAHPVVENDLTSGTVRVSSHKLNVVMRMAEELLLPQLATMRRASELREISSALIDHDRQRASQRHARQTGRRDNRDATAAEQAQQHTELALALRQLEDERQFVQHLQGQIRRVAESAENDGRSLAMMAGGLLYEVKQLHQLPFASLLQAFPRFTRELARDHGKAADLVVRGSEIEIDRRILEEIKAPLLHLLRNCVDHGIEMPAVREEKGKSLQGTIGIDIGQYDSRIRIAVSDDGAGMDTARLKTSAQVLGIISSVEAERLTEQEALALAFRSGITTSETITDISGRGLGLAIVLEKVERIGGEVTLETQRDAGTTFLITLPMTLATMRGILVRSADRQFVLPAYGVERVVRIAQQDILTLGRCSTVTLDAQPVALVDLSRALELPPSAPTAVDARGKVTVAVLRSATQRLAVGVDEVIGEQEVLVKTLAWPLARVRNVAGICMLDTGEMAVVLNVFDLHKSAVRQAGAMARMVITRPATQAVAPHSILLAEDSITSRMLLKNILESQGYRVKTAIDGLDAWGLLQAGDYDLLVSDVEMPHMDGFDLTARVRADRRLADLPVVLVTALGTREHRERGFDVGANAYLVKSSFDQSDLLEAIRRLI